MELNLKETTSKRRSPWPPGSTSVAFPGALPLQAHGRPEALAQKHLLAVPGQGTQAPPGSDCSGWSLAVVTGGGAGGAPGMTFPCLCPCGRRAPTPPQASSDGVVPGGRQGQYPILPAGPGSPHRPGHQGRRLCLQPLRVPPGGALGRQAPLSSPRGLPETLLLRSAETRPRLDPESGSSGSPAGRTWQHGVDGDPPGARSRRATRAAPTSLTALVGQPPGKAVQALATRPLWSVRPLTLAGLANNAPSLPRLTFPFTEQIPDG